MSKQKLAIGVLSVFAAATWGPILLKEEEAPRHVDMDDDEEDELGDDRDVAPRPRVAVTNPPRTRSQEAPRVATGSGEEPNAQAPSPHGLLDELRTLVPRSSRGGLNQLATAWAGDESTPTELETTAPALTSPLEDSHRRLEAFLESNPLSAILYRDNEPLALLGAHIVRPGQELEPGLKLVDIGPRSVLIASEGREVRLALPPVRSRRVSDPEAEDEYDEADELDDEETDR